MSAHLAASQRKLRNMARDARVALSIEGTEVEPPGLLQYLVVHGRARVTEGGAPELLQALAHRYLGPGVKFPPMDDPPRASCSTSRPSGSAASVPGSRARRGLAVAPRPEPALAAG